MTSIASPRSFATAAAKRFYPNLPDTEILNAIPCIVLGAATGRRHDDGVIFTDDGTFSIINR